jgi:D-alanyl-lipoteichoic acid acyltransferase DltB (MBOAT superfamily)
MMNIKIPQNFNAPYLALDIQDFWRRWHITLGRFLRDYIYIPLGGNRKGKVRTYANLFLTFFIGGVWHGAGWTFVLWGAMHGAALCLHRLWNNLGLRLPKAMAWLLTFLFVNAAWVVFRAENVQSAATVWKAMFGFPSLTLGLTSLPSPAEVSLWPLVGFSLLLCYVLQDLFIRTTQAWADRLRPAIPWTLISGLALAVCLVLMMNQNRFTEFIYFQF